jgi:hypothetical protein
MDDKKIDGRKMKRTAARIPSLHLFVTNLFVSYQESQPVGNALRGVPGIGAERP